MLLGLETWDLKLQLCQSQWHYVLKKVVIDIHGLVSWKQQILWITCLLNLILRIFLELEISSFSQEASPQYITYISHQDSQSRKINIEEILNDEYFSGIQENQYFFNIRTWHFRIFQTFELCNLKQTELQKMNLVININLH